MTCIKNQREERMVPSMKYIYVRGKRDIYAYACKMYKCMLSTEEERHTFFIWKKSALIFFFLIGRSVLREGLTWLRAWWQLAAKGCSLSPLSCCYYPFLIDDCLSSLSSYRDVVTCGRRVRHDTMGMRTLWGKGKSTHCISPINLILDFFIGWLFFILF